jgi:protein-tyrosine phosphatase
VIASFLRRILAFWRPEPRCRVLFVCMHNLCRSPTAEAVFRRHVEQAGLTGEVQCASAGVYGFYLGAAPDGRARAAALQRGYDMSRLRARGVSEADFERFDMILAMDQHNLAALTERCPPAHKEKLGLLMRFAKRHAVLDVPDPYFGPARGFERALDMIEDASSELVQHVRSTRLATPGS